MLVVRGWPPATHPPEASENWLRVDPRQDLRTVGQTTIYGLGPFMSSTVRSRLDRFPILSSTASVITPPCRAYRRNVNARDANTAPPVLY
uniref:Uncharacterized protein n=1 Tax=Solanum tuberosum TaxID=4113 RepID=M1DXF0_SOLTU